jgi:para-nitrobenzyl esterase
MMNSVKVANSGHTSPYLRFIMFFRVRFRITAAFILLGVCCRHDAQAQLVQTREGAVQGRFQQSCYSFLGIPFAQAPVGPLRWKPPLEVPVWADTLMALAFKPACPQKDFSQTDTAGVLKGDENCLYLNVWTPALGGKKPVMVFIHGGGNQQGSAADSAGGTRFYDGRNLSVRGDVVVVTLQYRLGALGFLVHPALEAESSSGMAGNYAVMDQLLALHWVKHNIAAFGGDSANITLFGESAGGVNTGNLLLSPQAAGLFHRAIIQSAVPNMELYAAAKTKGISWAQRFAGAAGTDSAKLAILRSLPADSFTAIAESPLKGGLLQMGWGPTHDGVLFPRLPTQAFEAGQFNRMPLIIGSNSDEMSLNAPPVVTPAMVNALVAARVPAAFQSQVLTMYPPGTSNAQARRSYVDILSDAQFNAPVRRTARCVSRNQGESVWQYFFSQGHGLPLLAPFGAYHGIELFYVFNNLENASIAAGPLFRPADDSTQKNTLAYWTHFAATGNPNRGIWPNWPVFSYPGECYLALKATPVHTRCELLKSRLDLWDQVIAYSACQASGLLPEPLPNSRELVFWPNPVRDILEVQDGEQFVSLSVYDGSGRRLRSFPGQSALYLETLRPGVYYLLADHREGQFYARFIKQ